MRAGTTIVSTSSYRAWFETGVQWNACNLRAAAIFLKTSVAIALARFELAGLK
ncbi:MAG: hypothetical protein ACRC9K_01065 [Afipia sp.]